MVFFTHLFTNLVNVCCNICSGWLSIDLCVFAQDKTVIEILQVIVKIDHIFVCNRSPIEGCVCE